MDGRIRVLWISERAEELPCAVQAANGPLPAVHWGIWPGSFATDETVEGRETPLILSVIRGDAWGAQPGRNSAATLLASIAPRSVRRIVLPSSMSKPCACILEIGSVKSASTVVP